MDIWKHESMEDYRQAQIDKNIRKFDTVWAKPIEIETICGIIKKNIEHPDFGICHGVRNGREVQYFKKNLGCDVIGTDISPTAEKVRGCVVHDFHDHKDEWESKADFVYSNSLDHAHSPEKALLEWKRQLRTNCLVFVGWFEKGGIDSADCFRASFEEVEEMIERVFGNVSSVDVGRKQYLVYWAKK